MSRRLARPSCSLGPERAPGRAFERAQGAVHTPAARPIWIDDAQPIFAMYHEPASPVERSSIAVQLCAPFGWENMGSYPIRRLWAMRLAEAGHPVLRFDLPGCGQSAGGPSDPQLLRGWLRAVAQTAQWLRHTGQATRVAAIGIGLGGLLALQAAAAGAAIDDLVLWGTPPSGRALTRRLRAFAQLQASAADGDDPALPDGWLQSGGYVLSAETLADLSALEPAGDGVGRVGRALLLDQDETASSPVLAERLRAASVEVECKPGPGYAAMLDSPELSVVPAATIATVAAWLARESSPTLDPDGPVPSAREELELEVDGVSVRERPFAVARSRGSMFGLLAEPAEPPERDICVICLSAWAERCVGPSRLWVEIARRHAARGVKVLRVDLESIGDSDGSPQEMRSQAGVWDPDRIVQVKQVMDALQRAGHGSRFLLVGLCSGGYWAQQALADPRVAGIVGLNPMVSPAGKAMLQSDAARRILSVLRPDWWLRVMRRQVNIKQGAITVAKGVKSRAWLPLRTHGGREPGAALALTALLDRLAERDAAMILGFAAEEVGYRQLELEGIAHSPERWPGLRIHLFESSDHNLRAVSDQRTIHVLVDELVAGVRSPVL
ncbi:MAG TPA: alpha/beta fold hydrolase [Solirubrobacteraceae bacterium]|nr:alpha/beta fold hydrolase [Solirubrobacteraceae bacterium]